MPGPVPEAEKQRGAELDAELPSRSLLSHWGWAVLLLAQRQGAPFSQNTM